MYSFNQKLSDLFLNDEMKNSVYKLEQKEYYIKY